MTYAIPRSRPTWRAPTRWSISPRWSWGGGPAREVNIEGSRNVFDAAKRQGVGTVVHASSAAAYGCAPENDVPLTESSPLRPEPDFYYPRTKVAVERLIESLEAEDPDTRFVRFRPVATVGPGAPLALGGRLFVTLSDFDPLVQFTWIDDVVEAFTAALHEPVRGPFNIGGPDPVRTSEVPALIGVRGVRIPYRLARLGARTGSAIRLPGALHPGWADMGRYPIVVDTARAERELGWRANTTAPPRCGASASCLRERRRAGSDIPIPREASR